MTQWHHIFCRSAAALSSEELAEYVADSWYGDGSPNITSTPDGTVWHELIVEFSDAPSQRVELLLDSAPEVMAGLFDEFLDEHGARVPPEVADLVRSSEQVVSIGLGPDLPSDDVWELLDQTQAFIAGRLDGILAISGEGVYDRDLQLLVDLDGSPA